MLLVTPNYVLLSGISYRTLFIPSVVIETQSPYTPLYRSAWMSLDLTGKCSVSMCGAHLCVLTGFFYVTDSPDTIQYVTITKVSLLQSCMNTNSKTLPPAATIHTPAEPIHSPITRSRSAVRKDRAKPRTPCKQSRALDIPSRRDEGPAPSAARFRAGRSAADLSAFKAALQRVLGCVL